MESMDSIKSMDCSDCLDCIHGLHGNHGIHRNHGIHGQWLEQILSMECKESMDSTGPWTPCGRCRRHGSLLMKQWKGASLVQEWFLQTSAGRSFKKCGLTKSITRCCFTDTHLGLKAVLSEHGPSSSVHINVRQHRPYVCVLVNKSDSGTWLEWFHKLSKP